MRWCAGTARKGAGWASPRRRQKAQRDARSSDRASRCSVVQPARSADRDGGAADVRDTTGGSARSGRTTRTAGDRSGCPTGSGLTCRSARDRTGGSTGTGLTTGSTRNHTGSATRACGALRTARDVDCCATRTGSTDISTRGSIGIDARRWRRHGLCHRSRGEGERRSCGTCEQCRGHLRKFHHHVSLATTSAESLNLSAANQIGVITVTTDRYGGAPAPIPGQQTGP